LLNTRAGDIQKKRAHGAFGSATRASLTAAGAAALPKTLCPNVNMNCHRLTLHSSVAINGSVRVNFWEWKFSRLLEHYYKWKALHDQEIKDKDKSSGKR
jgi:hypothetical protein